MPFAYSKKNSYRRKTRSYKKFGTKRYSRKRVARSSGYRQFHSLKVVTDVPINTDPSGRNMAIYSAYSVLRNNPTFLSYCNMYEQFKVSGMTIRLSNLGGTDYAAKPSVVIKYASMTDRNGQSAGRYNTYTDIESLQSSKTGLWTYGGRSTAYESVFARTLQEKSIYIATDDILNIPDSSQPAAFHVLNTQWDPNYLFALYGPVSTGLQMNMDVKVYVQFRGAREITNSTAGFSNIVQINKIGVDSSVPVRVQDMDIGSNITVTVQGNQTLVEIINNQDYYYVKQMRPAIDQNYTLTQGSKYHVFASETGYVFFYNDGIKICRTKDSTNDQVITDTLFYKSFFVFQ